jgi:hypothetical protein
MKYGLQVQFILDYLQKGHITQRPSIRMNFLPIVHYWRELLLFGLLKRERNYLIMHQK